MTTVLVERSEYKLLATTPSRMYVQVMTEESKVM